jgi:hypothetical protein
MQVYAAGSFGHRYCLQFNVSSVEKTAWMVNAPHNIPTAQALAAMPPDHQSAWRELGQLFEPICDAQFGASAAAPSTSHPDDGVAAVVTEWRPRPLTLLQLSLPSWSASETTSSLLPANASWKAVPYTRKYRYLGVTVDDSGPTYLGRREHRTAAATVFRLKAEAVATSPTKHFPPWFVATVYNTHVRQPTLYCAAVWMCDGVPQHLESAEQATLRRIARAPAGVTLSAPLLRSACGVKSIAYGLHVQIIGHLLSVLKLPADNGARQVLQAEVRQWQHYRNLEDTHETNVQRWRTLGSRGQPPRPLCTQQQSEQMRGVWWHHVHRLLSRMSDALAWMVSEARPPSLSIPPYDKRGIAQWHTVVEVLASGRTPPHIVGHAEPVMAVQLLSGDEDRVPASGVLMRLTAGYKAALYALEVYERVDTVLRSTAVADVRRWVWHPVPAPLHRCNNGEAVALRTRCRMGLSAAIGVNWYQRLTTADRKACILCGLLDRDVPQLQDGRRKDDEVADPNAAPQRAFSITHVFGECTALKDARLACWEQLRCIAVTAGVHKKAHVDAAADRSLWLDFMMGAPVPESFMAVGLHNWHRWYTNMSATKVGTAPRLDPVYFRLMTAAAPFLKLVVQRVQGAIASRRGVPPGVQFPPLPRLPSMRRPLPGVAPLPVPPPASAGRQQAAVPVQAALAAPPLPVVAAAHVAPAVHAELPLAVLAALQPPPADNAGAAAGDRHQVAQ